MQTLVVPTFLPSLSLFVESHTVSFKAMELNNNTVCPYWFHPHWLAQENNTTTERSIADNRMFGIGLGINGRGTEFDVMDHYYGKRVQDITSSSPTFERVDNRISTDDACRERLASARDSSGQETKKKGIQRWTEDEHRRFVNGLQKHSNKWTLISREHVVTKSREQVASHAQKYFARQQEKTSGENKSRKRRKSIHDITIENVVGESNHMPAPAPYQNQAVGVGIPQVQQAGWINHHSGISSGNLNAIDSLDSTFHGGSIGFNQNGHYMSDTSCYESHILVPLQDINSMWGNHYNGEAQMGFNSNAANTLEPCSFGCSTDDTALPPFP